jgi:hypothetical protein
MTKGSILHQYKTLVLRQVNSVAIGYETDALLTVLIRSF